MGKTLFAGDRNWERTRDARPRNSFHQLCCADQAHLLTSERIYFHEVEMMNYPLFEHPPDALALATKMADVALNQNLDLLHVHYAIPHSVSAYLAKEMLRPHRLPVITTLHGTDITLVGNDRSYLPITKFSIEKSDGVTAVSVYLRDLTYREFEVSRPIEMIPNFVNCDVFRRSENGDLKQKIRTAGRTHPGACL